MKLTVGWVVLVSTMTVVAAAACGGKPDKPPLTPDTDTSSMGGAMGADGGGTDVPSNTPNPSEPAAPK
jgi:hypothetical protein